MDDFLQSLNEPQWSNIEPLNLNDALPRFNNELPTLNDEGRKLIIEVKSLNIQAKSVKAYVLSMNFDLLRRKVVAWRVSRKPAKKKKQLYSR